MFGSFCLFRWGVLGLFGFWLVFILARFDCTVFPSSLIVSDVFLQLLWSKTTLLSSEGMFASGSGCCWGCWEGTGGSHPLLCWACEALHSPGLSWWGDCDTALGKGKTWRKPPPRNYQLDSEPPHWVWIAPLSLKAGGFFFLFFPSHPLHGDEKLKVRNEPPKAHEEQNTTCFKWRERLMGKINIQRLQPRKGGLFGQNLKQSTGFAGNGKCEMVGQGTHSPLALLKNNSAGFF